ncbi:MAG TPA: hypothetical protein DF480_03110 [Clostridiales bacterium]|nr:hypothetical protein [Clostridiales bacterium]
MKDNILDVQNLKVYFPIKGDLIPKVVGHVKAVDDVSFHLGYGETLGLVGESGCGKSTTGRAILRLVKAQAGSVIFEGRDILQLKKQELKTIRKDMQLMFQDPFAALNPRMSIGDALEEVLYVHRIGLKTERKKKAEELIETVELNRAYLARFPHELSGGQRQRIVLARALAVNPKLLICDEPVSALDVSIQAQIVNLLEELQKNLNITYLFIAHDLSVVKHISKRIAVMYLGKIVETATSDELFQNPRHPYTKALLAAVPSIDPDHKKEKILLEGDMPNIINPPKGCRFNSRCQFAVERCYSEEPIITDLGGGHTVNCHLFT